MPETNCKFGRRFHGPCPLRFLFLALLGAISLLGPRSSAAQGVHAPAPGGPITQIGDLFYVAPPRYPSAGNQALTVATADFNRDGILDLAVSNLCSVPPNCGASTMGILLGNGDGSFRLADVVQGGFSATVGDFNGDGKPDLVVNGGDAYVYYVLLGNGDGTFQDPIVFPTEGYAGIAVGDFNGDGKSDFVLEFESGEIAPYLSNGDGTFRQSASYATLGGVTVVGDFNHDGKLDFVVSRYCPGEVPDCSGSDQNETTYVVFLGNGDGTFRQLATSTFQGSHTTSIASADFNRDGNADLAISSCPAGTFESNCNDAIIVVLLGKGDGSFPVQLAQPSDGPFPGVVAADFDGDGKPDLALGYACQSTICGMSAGILKGNGDGTFRPAMNYSDGGFAVSALAVGDFNGDGKLDLTLVDSCTDANCDGFVSILLGTGNGKLQAPSVYAGTGSSISEVAALAFNGNGRPGVPFDFDSNGWADLAVADLCATLACTTGSLDIALQTSAKVFQESAIYPSGPYSKKIGGVTSVVVGDFNGDGKWDSAVVNNCADSNCDGSVGVFLGNGNGTFEPEVSYATGAFQSASAVLGDFNNDGQPDLAVTSQCISASDCKTSTVSVLLGNADGTFLPPAVYPLRAGAYSVVIGDFNGDGKIDLAVALRHHRGIEVLLGNGDGTFQPGLTTSWPGLSCKYCPSSDGLVAGDFNHDGRLDLAVLDLGEVKVLLGKGTGLFESPVSYDFLGDCCGQSPVPLASIVAADFNGDGNLDLGVANSYGAIVSLGNPDGTFQSPILIDDYFVLPAPSIAVGDFNHDGKPDLALPVSDYTDAYAVELLLNVASGFRYSSALQVGASTNPSQAGQQLTFTVEITPSFNAGSMTGTVTFQDGTSVLGTAPVVNGQAQLTTSSLAVGGHFVFVTYSGDANYSPESSLGFTQTVLPYPTITALTSEPNPSLAGERITFSSQITSPGPAPTGKVTFFDGTTKLGSAKLKNGVAKLTEAKLAAGTHPITAQYSGDSNSGKSISPVVNQVVNP